MAFMDFLPQFSDNTDQSINDPNLAAINLKRKLALADSLRNSPVLEGQMVSGRYVAPSWTQNLANAVNKGVGMYTERQAMKEYGDILKSQEAKQRTGLDKLIKVLKNEPTLETTMQPTNVDLQQGMNVPTSPFTTNEQVSQIYPNYSGQTPIQNMQGQTNVMQPITTQVPAKPLSQNDVLSAIAQYGQDVGNPKIGEGVILDYAKQMYAPKKSTWIKNGDVQIQIDETGQPTGKTLPIGISPDTAATLEQSGKQHNITNKFKERELEIEKKKLNPLNLPDLSASSKPLTNKKGWTLHTDANGNQAYVSPDGKNYEEAN
jgi:hypothetical protein